MDLRAEETKLLSEFVESCKRLLEIDAELVSIHSQLVAVGGQGQEPWNRRDVLAAAKDLVTREQARQRRIEGTTKSQPNRPSRPDRVYKLKK